MSGQHVGRQSDSLVEDAGQSAARAQARALAALARPQSPRRGRSDVGDGDICPLEQAHGRMVYLHGSKRQYCPHQSHDTKTRAFWPQGYRSFADAVAGYNAPTAVPADLPELDINLGG